MFWSLFIFCELPTLEPIPLACDDEQVDIFHSVDPHTESYVSNTYRKGKLERRFARKEKKKKEKEVEWTRKVKNKIGRNSWQKVKRV